MASQLLPTTNGDGLPIVPMSEAQRYIFDLKGWICLPGLLSDDELGTVLEHQHKLMEEPESLPPEERNSVGGPSQVMLDHPVLAGVLNEIVSHQGLASEDCYGFRFERTRTERRPFGHDKFVAHGGGGYFNLCGNSHLYQMLPGKIHAGLTRVVWELNEVGPGDGVTMFIREATRPRSSGRTRSAAGTAPCGRPTPAPRDQSSSSPRACAIPGRPGPTRNGTASACSASTTR